ncbi:MAG: hypothetical protein MUE40_15460 [Anaerolineae bacterium]|jgi:hypothetical protein|nr:hypothetical protein [Anaerolineae bacterium]
MRTPAGKECAHYYQDFHRGRDVQECRLEKANPQSARWQPGDCSKCPVPDILLANADPDMQLTLTIRPGFMGFFRRLEVVATSRSDGSVISDPYVGKGKDSPALDLFRKALEDTDHD